MKILLGKASMDIQEERKNILLQEGEIHNQTHYLDVKIQLIGKAINNRGGSENKFVGKGKYNHVLQVEGLNSAKQQGSFTTRGSHCINF